MQDVNVEEVLSAPVATLHSKIQEGFSPPLQDSFLENKSRQVHSLFQRQACLLAARKKIPWLSESKGNDGALVRYLGMVQDMYDSEFYPEGYYDPQKERLVVTSYLEYFEEASQLERVSPVMGLRHPIYCVPVPGLSPWADTSDTQNNASCSQPSRPKRMAAQMEDISSATESSVAEHDKRVKHSTPEIPSKSEYLPLNLNYPLPNQTGQVCIVKMYHHQEEHLKIGDVVEFIGIAWFNCAMQVDDDCGFPDQEVARNPPGRLVPRLHCLAYRQWPGIELITHPRPFPYSSLEIRTMMVTFLSTCLDGDRLAAEYLLLSIISRTYSRQGTIPLGKLSLNLQAYPGVVSSPIIGNVTEPSEAAKTIHHALSKICTTVVLHALSVHNLCNLSYYPKKNYSTNRLDSGILQLSKGTVLLVDETTLNAGKLGTNGTNNLKALSSVLETQQLSYDFQYHEMRFDVDISVVVLSQSKSMLKCSVSIPVKASNRGKSEATLHQLDILRAYLLEMNHKKACDIEESVSQAIQNDIVASRQANPTLSVETLHSWMTAARWIHCI